MNKFLLFPGISLFMIFFVGITDLSAKETLSQKPINLVLILTDNQATWSLGCYGNDEILTPNIDNLAHEGILFERSFSSNPVCSPTRATLLTGLIPSQHGIHNYLSGGAAQTGPNPYNMIEEFRSLPEILSGSGYVCGLSGKWHLGDNLHPQEGFSYWITMPHGHTTTFYDADIIENGKIRKEPTYLTDFWTDHGIRFIEQNKDKPFFLFLAFNGPYGLGQHLNNPSKNRFAEYYSDKQLNSFPREKPHPWLKENRAFIGNMVSIRRYASEVSGVDYGVGKIMDALKRMDLDENTLVIFMADQGLCGGHHGMWGMADHGRPLHTFDETLHIPTIWRHPDNIPAGKRSDVMISNYDFLPTVLSYLGLKDKTPVKNNLPGRDYSDVLKGKNTDWENVVYYEYDNTRLIRTPEWKYTERLPVGGCIDELYDLVNDPSEKNNLIHVREYAEIKQDLQKKLHAFFDSHANLKYDLWRNGRSKTQTLPVSKNNPLPPPVK